jgi:chaperone BCS1
LNELTQFAKTLPPWAILFAGVAAGWLRNFWMWLYNHTLGMAARRIMVSVEVEECDHADAYLWLQAWVERRLSERRISALQLRRKAGVYYNYEKPMGAGDEDGEDRDAYELVPTYGVYPFRWRRRYLIIFASQKADQTAPSGGDFRSFGLPRRNVTLSIWGTRERRLLLELIAEAREQWLLSHPTALEYFFHRYSYWKSRPMAQRPRHTVYLPYGLLDEILSDARGFLEQKAIFQSLGIPWRRGYLLYGPPGGGKTTLVQCIATELHLPLYYLSLASLRSREDLAELLDSVAPNSILLIEDIDCITAAVSRMNAENAGQKGAEHPQPTLTADGASLSEQKITPSDLLNFIDGIIASQGRLLVMTTNHPENLDPALVRAGRVDRRWEITYAAREELRAFHAAVCDAGVRALPFAEFLTELPHPCTIADAQAKVFRARAAEECEYEPCSR